MGTCERREIQCRIHGKCKQWSSCWSWNFPAAGKQTKLNLIGRIRHVTRLRANSVHLARIRFHIVLIETANFSLRFHLASTGKRLETRTFENNIQREQYENDTKTMCRCNIVVAFSLKTYLCRRGLGYQSSLHQKFNHLEIHNGSLTIHFC